MVGTSAFFHMHRTQLSKLALVQKKKKKEKNMKTLALSGGKKGSMLNLGTFLLYSTIRTYQKIVPA